MYYLKINGKQKLKGAVDISGAKNSALPLLAVSIISKSRVIIKNIPNVTDIKTFIRLLENLGAKIKFKDSTVIIETKELNSIAQI